MIQIIILVLEWIALFLLGVTVACAVAGYFWSKR